jgi:hypothetical protein
MQKEVAVISCEILKDRALARGAVFTKESLVMRIRPIHQLIAEDEFQEAAFYGVGQLQSRDMDVASSLFEHTVFIKYHYGQNIFNFAKGLKITQVHRVQNEQLRVHGTYLTDVDDVLVAYCVENRFSRELLGNKAKVIASIKLNAKGRLRDQL